MTATFPVLLLLMSGRGVTVQMVFRNFPRSSFFISTVLSAEKRDRKGTPKNLRDKDFGELSGELSGAICLKTLVFIGQSPRTVQKILWCCSCDSLALGCFSLWVDKRVVFHKGGFGGCSPRNENRNEGIFGCSPGTKTGTRARSHVSPERKPERGHVRQNHPFTKPPFCLPVIFLALEEKPKGLLMMVSKRWFEFGLDIEFRYPLLTSIEPQFNLLFTSILPLFTSFLPQFNLCFVGNLQPRFGNHGLHTLGKRCKLQETAANDTYRQAPTVC